MAKGRNTRRRRRRRKARLAPVNLEKLLVEPDLTDSGVSAWFFGQPIPEFVIADEQPPRPESMLLTHQLYEDRPYPRPAVVLLTIEDLDLATLREVLRKVKTGKDPESSRTNELN